MARILQRIAQRELVQDMSEREVFPSLTGLRFVLALWIALYHLALLYGPANMSHSPWIAAGAARVDIFFVLSGFVLTHVYAIRTGGRIHFGKFLAARIGRLYPLHLAALALLGLLVVGAHLLGQSQQVADYTPLGLIANLFMLQAWGVPGAGQWNFPAWTLSAEFFAYFCFPAFIWVGARLAARPLAFWGFVIALVAGLSYAWPALGFGQLADATQVLGIIRGACCVFVGVAARYVFEPAVLRSWQAWLVALAGAMIAASGAIAEAPLWVVAAGASGLILGFAALDRAKALTLLNTPILEELGRWSYGLFVLHVPIFIALEQAFPRLGWDGPIDLAKGAVMLAVALCASAPAHYWIEEPARKLIRAAYERRAGAQKPLKVAN